MFALVFTPLLFSFYRYYYFIDDMHKHISGEWKQKKISMNYCVVLLMGATVICCWFLSTNKTNVIRITDAVGLFEAKLLS